jgi:hypothetical protein
MNTKLFNAVDAGHTYELAHHEGDGVELVHFIKKAPIDEGELETVQDGTTNEAIISMLIDRLQFLNEKMHSPKNDEAIKHLHLAFEALSARTADREERGVEGTQHE